MTQSNEAEKFLPISRQDMEARGWTECDVILITGDAYVDHPSYGNALIARVLEDAGYKVGIIAQPNWKTSTDFLALGKPRLFFGISAGNLDSMVNHYTASKKPRRTDSYAPGGKSGLRPNRATIVYCNKARELFPGVPIMIGGVEASLRRLSHFDYWEESVRRSMLLDSKADILVYGMGERATLEIAKRAANGEPLKNLRGIRGTVTAQSDLNGIEDACSIPSYEETLADKNKFNEAFRLAYFENDAIRGRTVVQKHGNRFVVQMPPALPLTEKEMDYFYSLPFARASHRIYDKQGGVPGFETVRFSVTAHRGCSGECFFCSLTAHQGRIVQSRSKESVLKEVEQLTKDKHFKGTITDIGGPTANLYGASCEAWESSGACKNKQCMMPKKCANLKLGYDEAINLWRAVMQIKGVRHFFIQSGLRYDLMVDNTSDEYLEELCKGRVSGQLKVAPEHASDKVLKLMNKPSFEVYEKFEKKFYEMCRKVGKEQYLVNYFVSAHPGSNITDAKILANALRARHIHPEQVQDFIPLPMTVSACMYYTGRHPFTNEAVETAKTYKERETQREIVQPKRRMSKLGGKR